MKISKVHYTFLILILMNSSCRQSLKVKNEPEAKGQFGFVTLKFEEDGKPCIALISEKTIVQADRKKFPLSLFVEITTREAGKNGHPTGAESDIFHALETEIFKSLQSGIGDFSFVGNTTMPNYRDIILYIPAEQQQAAATVLNRIKSQNSRLKSFTFELDPEWEAVSSFQEAIQSEN